MVRLNEVRPGELAVDLPARTDAEVYFIGRIRTPWTNRLECPRQGRPDGPTCRIEVFPPWDKGLDSIASSSGWRCSTGCMSRGATLRCRVQGATSGAWRLLAAHAGATQPHRHSIVELVKVEGAALFVRGMDCLDGTPLIDLKPDRTLFKPLAPAQAGDFQAGDK